MQCMVILPAGHDNPHSLLELGCCIVCHEACTPTPHCSLPGFCSGVSCSQPPRGAISTRQVYEPPLTPAIKEIIEYNLDTLNVSFKNKNFVFSFQATMDFAGIALIPPNTSRLAVVAVRAAPPPKRFLNIQRRELRGEREKRKRRKGREKRNREAAPANNPSSWSTNRALVLVDGTLVQWFGSYFFPHGNGHGHGHMRGYARSRLGNWLLTGLVYIRWISCRLQCITVLPQVEPQGECE